MGGLYNGSEFLACRLGEWWVLRKHWGTNKYFSFFPGGRVGKSQESRILRCLLDPPGLGLRLALSSLVQRPRAHD